mmetsp:Transcript_72798/g.128264  ORF Transcript_72798/g.128264 Transcript_72798/m.128264 type:complete len:274 (-) Transcript_72798:193-1014(-)
MTYPSGTRACISSWISNWRVIASSSARSSATQCSKSSELRMVSQLNSSRVSSTTSSSTSMPPGIPAQANSSHSSWSASAGVWCATGVVDWVVGCSMSSISRWRGGDWRAAMAALGTVPESGETSGAGWLKSPGVHNGLNFMKSVGVTKPCIALSRIFGLDPALGTSGGVAVPTLCVVPVGVDFLVVLKLFKSDWNNCCDFASIGMTDGGVEGFFPTIVFPCVVNEAWGLTQLWVGLVVERDGLERRNMVRFMAVVVHSAVKGLWSKISCSPSS